MMAELYFKGFSRHVQHAARTYFGENELHILQMSAASFLGRPVATAELKNYPRCAPASVHGGPSPAWQRGEMDFFF